MTRLPFDHRRWGNRVIVNRSLDLWREYGAESGLFELKKAWSKFLFTRDARDLGLVPAVIGEIADEVYQHNLSEGIPLWGGEMYKQYNDQRDISAREINTWRKAFTEAYSEQIEEKISEIIPPELDGKLAMFCNTVSAIAQHLESGGDSDDFGVSLGRKVQELVKIHPKKAEIISKASREGASEAQRNWGWQESGSYSIRAPYVSSPFDWELDRFEDDLYEETYLKAYFGTIRSYLEKLVPLRVWKNAFLICSLHDEMQAQKDRKKKYGSQKGWSYLRSTRDHDLFMTERRRDAARKVYEEKSAPRTPSPTMGIMDPAQFSSPRVSITSGAKAAFEESGEQPAKYLDRHFSGDFGELTEHDAALNRESLTTNGMVMSIYTLSTGVRFYIITDDGHAMTTILLPSEY